MCLCSRLDLNQLQEHIQLLSRIFSSTFSPNPNTENFQNFRPNAQYFLFPVTTPNSGVLDRAPAISGPDENWANTGNKLPFHGVQEILQLFF